LEAAIGSHALNAATAITPPAKIAGAVVEDIAELSNYPASQIGGDYVLSGAPLLFSDYGLTALAQRLWALIKTYNPEGYITVAEVRQGGLTVAALVTLVVSRCQ
jgi:hypothetical protein